MTATLLMEFETLSDAQRLARMRELGQIADAGSEAAATISALEGGGSYERRLALHSCFTSRDGAHVLRALSDASRLVRGEAIALAAIVCDDEQAAQGLSRLGLPAQRALLRRLLRANRRAVIDAFVGALPDDDDRRGRLLPYCSAPIVQDGLDAVQERMGVDDWKRLAHLHPDLALTHLQRRAAATSRIDHRLLWHANAAFPELARLRPDASVELLQTVLQNSPPTPDLVRLRPQESAALVIASERPANASFERSAHLLNDEQLLDLARNRPETLGRAMRWIARLSPINALWPSRKSAQAGGISKEQPLPSSSNSCLRR